MKRIVLLIVITLFCSFLVNAQVSKTQAVTAPGSLITDLTHDELITVTNLTLTGEIDAKDFKTMRDEMPVLAELDLSGTTIVAYSGTDGTEIGNYYDYQSNAIPPVAFYNQNTGIGKTSLTTILFPLSITTIGMEAFSHCTGLSSLNISGSIISIEYGALAESSGFITVEDSNPNYSSLDGVLFDKTKSLLIHCPTSNSGDYTIPASVEIIGERAFSGCSNLVSVNIPSSVSSIQFTANGMYPFYRCSGLITVEPGNPNYSSLDGVLFNKTKTTILQCSTYRSGSYEIPPSVTIIWNLAFTDCTFLTSITIPASVTSIRDFAFSGCSGLTSIYTRGIIPASLSVEVYYAVKKETCILYVTYGTKNAFQSTTTWQDFANIVEMPGYTVSANTANVAAPEASTAAVDLTSNVAWTALSDKDWLSVDPASGVEPVSGSANQTLTFTAHANTSVAPRSAVVTISSTGVDSKTITITQAGSGAPLNLVSAGSLISSFTADELLLITKLTLTGNIDARDFKTMRDEMPLLAEIDLSGATIAEYIGPDATYPWDSSYDYPANTLPDFAFFDPSKGIGKVSLRSLLLPSTATSIGNQALQGCTGLSSITIPSSVVSIGSNTFSNCSGLTSVNLPSSLTSIGDWAFSGCVGVTSITIPSSVTTLGSYAFVDCTGLTTVVLPSSITSIGVATFQGCSSLSSVNIPSSVTSVGQNSFLSCTSLSSITIPISVTSIGSQAFYACSGLTTINAQSVTPIDLSSSGSVFGGVSPSTCALHVSYGSAALYAIAPQWLDFTNVVEDPGFRLSTSSVNMTATGGSADPIAISANVAWSAGSDQAWLTPDPASFTNDHALTLTAEANTTVATRTARVTISSPGVVSQTITVTQAGMPKSVNATAGSLAGMLSDGERATITKLILTGTIDARDFKTMRDDMPLLAEIDMSGATIAAYNAEGGTYPWGSYDYPVNAVPEYSFYNPWANFSKTSLISVILPSNVTSLSAQSFLNCTGLTSIILSASLTTIGDNTFQGCSGLTSLVIPTSVTSIGYSAFYSCTGLTTLTIPPSVKSLGQNSFMYCNSLTSVTIPIAVNSIGSNAFYGCSNLKSIFSHSVTPVDLTSSPNVFTQVDKTSCTLHISYGSAALYAAAPQWQDFTNVVEDPGFRLSSSTVSLPSTAGSADPIAISANVAWSAGSDQAWLTPDPASFINDHALTLTAEANPTVATRTARVTISSPGVVSQTITVTQTGMPKTADVTAGGLAGMLTDGERATITKLILTGTIDARDFKTMRDDMPLLAEIDMSGAAIASYSGPDGTYPYAADYPADAVPDFAFYNVWTNNSKTGLNSILFPSTVKSIGNQSLQDCSGLSSITIPPSVVSIGNNAFANCNKLNTVDLSSSLTSIGSAAFQNCSSLISISIPPSVHSIEDHVFYHCYGLTNVNIPSTVTSIGDWAFYGCSGLASLIIPSSVANIGYAAFYDCSGLTNFTIPSSVTAINNETFRNCSALTSVTIPSSVTSIGANAFIYCSNLSSVTIPISVNSIGYQAFYGCSALASIYAQSVTPVDLTSSWNVFLGVNTSTCTLHISYGSAALYAAALQWQDFMNVVEDPGFRFSTFAVSLPATGGSADPIAISANVAWSAGSDQSWLTPDPASFTNDHALTLTAEANTTVATRTARVTISSPGVVSQTITVTQAGMPKTVNGTAGSLASALTHDELQTITKLILNGTIDARDFKTMRDDMPLLAEIDMSGATIAEYSGPDGTYPWASSYVYSVSTVPDLAFFNPSTNVGKTSLTSILLPLTATSLGNQSLQGCTGLSSITLPSSVVSIGSNAFSDCNGLTSISLPPSLTSIGGWAFSSCTGLTSFTIPSTVTSIERYAFYNCTGLSSIDIPSSMTSLSDGTFESCTGLISVNIPSSVTSIGSYAFNYCGGLTSVTIPISVTTIGSQAFYSCNNLAMIYAKSVSPVSLNSSYNVFYGVATSTCALHVSYGSAGLYGNADQWKDFTNVVEDPGFRLSTSSVNMAATGGSADPIAISANVAWSAASDQSWLTPDPTSFTNDHALTLTAEANPTVATRMASVTISSPGVVSQTITVTQAGMPKTVDVTAGGLAAMLTEGERAAITKLILTGTIDARDFKTMRDDMPLLAEIDMNGATIAPYFGPDGTYPWGGDYDFAANTVPVYSFFNPTTGISKTSLTSVILPSSAIALGQNAFYNCTGLSSIVIPPSVVSIGNQTFSGCSGLTLVTLSSSLTSIGYDAFNSCRGLSDMTIPSSVTSLGSNAFSQCSGLTSLSISTSLTTIEYGTFQGCSGLTTVVIPSSVTSIGNYAFNSCIGLTSVSIPSSVTSLGERIFQTCQSLTSVSIPSSVKTIGSYAFYNCTALTSVTIPSSVTAIENGTFYNCTGLTSITIGSSVHSIGAYAFYNCSGLTSLTIPISVNAIGGQAFYGCSGLTSIFSQTTAPVSLNSSPNVFRWVDKLSCTLNVSYGTAGLYKTADQWKDFTNIAEDPGFRLSILSVNFAASGGSADPISVSANVIWSANSDQGWLVPDPASNSGDHSLTLTAEANTSVATRTANVTIASPGVVSQVITVTQIGVPKFLEATAGNLGTTLTPDELATATKLILTGTIDARDFKTMRDDMPLLADIDMSGATVIAYTGTEGTYPWYSDYLANAVPEYSFADPATNTPKTSLTSILLPSNSISIGSYAFYGCSNLPSITVPSSVISVGSYTFSNCSGLTSVNLPASLKTIGDWAFSSCTGLTALTIPASVTTIANYAFAECSKLISISIPPLVTAIGEGIFQNCTGLTTVNIPSTVVSIGYGAFNNCQSLSSISIPSSVKSIGTYCFANCSSLTAIVIPLSVTSIAEGTFQSCHGLTSFTIPGSVSSIGSQAFYDCSGLTSITADRSIPVDLSSSPDVFYNVDKTSCILNVPFGTNSAYSVAPQWSEFSNISGAASGFSLSSVAVNLAAAAGSSSDITIKANVAWSVVSSEPSWLTASPSSSSNDGTITLIATGNAGLNRTATVTVSSTGIGDQTIVVTQATSLIPLTLSDNKDNTAPIVDQSLNLVITNNRWGYFRFMPTVSSTYTFSSSSLKIDPYGALYDNSGNYLANGYEEVGSNFNFSYTLTAGQFYYFGIFNYNGDNLNVAVQITGGGLQSLWLSTNSVSLEAPAGSNAIVDVTDRTSWSASSDQTWLTLSPETGLTSGAMTLTATENTGSTRIATVTVSSSGSLNQLITVTQSRVDTPINITAGTLSTVLSATDLSSITKLTLTGNIDARDFKTMRDDMPLLTEIDLSGTTVVAYSGTEGTYLNYQNYPADEIPVRAFFNPNTGISKVNLISFVFPSTVTSISSLAFYNCTGLVSANLPSLVYSIGSQSFSGCNRLASVFIPGSVTSIGSYAFDQCRGLTSLFIPSSVTSIGGYAFRGIQCLIDVDAANTNYSGLDGVLFNKAQTLLIQYPGSKSGGYSIPPTVITIGSGAFIWCNNLSSVEIPASVKIIENQAFYNCNGLTSITIPSTVTSIQGYAFAYCYGWPTITAGWSVPLDLTASDQVFSGINNASTTLHVPYKTASKYQTANQWMDFTIVEATEGFSLGSNAVTLASGAGSNAAVSVTANVAWTVSSDQSWLVPGPLSGSNDGSIMLTAEANTGFDRFAIVTVSSPGQSDQVINVTQSTGLTPLTLSENMDSTAPIVDQVATLVTSYTDKYAYSRFMPTVNGSYSFSSTSDSDPYGILYDHSGNYLIEQRNSGSNFNFTYSLTAGQVYYFGVYNPNGSNHNIVVNITGGGLQSLWLSSNSVSLAAPEGSNAIVDVTDRNSWSASSDQSWLIVTPETDLSSGPLKLTASENTGSTRIATVTVKSSGSIDQVVSVTQFRSDAPINITAGTLSTVLSATDLALLTKLTLTGNIDARDFKTMRDDMPLLAEIDLSEATVVAYSGTEGTFYPNHYNYPNDEIPYHAFNNPNTGNGKTSLISFVFPSTITAIGSSAFSSCYGLVSINLPSFVSSVDNNAFSNCNGLTSIFIPASVASIGVYAFEQCRGLTSLFIPVSVKTISNFAFRGIQCPITVDPSNPNYSSLDGILFDKAQTLLIQYPGSKSGGYSIPPTVITVGQAAFWACGNLSSIEIPSSVKVIGAQAFWNCYRLTSLTIPTTVTSIQANAFEYCYDVTSITAGWSVALDISVSNQVFNGINKDNCILHVPFGAATRYRIANQWQDFTNIVEASEGFSLGSNAVTLASGAGSNASVSVTANVAWTVSSDQSWLVPGPLSGSNDGSIMLTAEANTGFDRTATVTVSSPGFSNQTIVVTQSSGIIPLTLSDNMNNSAPIFDQASMLVTSYIDKMGYFRFMPTVSGNYTFSSVSNSDPQGVIYDNYGNFRIGRHQYGSEFNFSYYLGAGEVYYFGVYNPNGGGQNIIVNITGGGLQSLWLSTNSVSLATSEGSHATVDVTDRTSWSASSDQAWLTLSPESGLSSGPLKLTASENTGSSRIAIVTVSSPGSISQVITVSQARSDAPITITAGKLSSILTSTDLLSITKLTLTGTIDARDFKTMRDDMPLLAEIDLSGVKVAAYSGDGGTYPYNSDYPVDAVPDYSFYNAWVNISKTILTSFILPPTVTSIGNGAFKQSGLTSLNIASSIVSIGDEAFNNCNGLSTLTIPTPVSTVGSQSFSFCQNLTSVTIAGSVTSIEDLAFYGASGPITVDGSNPNYSSLDGILFDKTQNLFIHCPVSKTGSYIIPSSVSSIARYSFYGCSNLTSITIPSSVSLIGDRAFISCSGLSSIYSNKALPVNLNFSANVFEGIDKTICILYVPYGTAARYRAANQWRDFANIVEATEGFNLSANTATVAAAAGSTTTIDVNANVAWSVSLDQLWLTVNPTSESGNKTLTFTAEANSVRSSRTAIVTVSATGFDAQSVTVTQEASDTPVNIVTAGSLSTVLSADELSTITKLVLTGNIDARDFKTMRDYMPLLTEIDLSGATIAAYSGTEGTYPNNYTYPANEIPRNAFWNQNTGNSKTNLISFAFPSTVVSIGFRAFSNCTGLVFVNLPSLVSSIGDQAFSNCNGLISIYIPESVTSIGSYAFQNCISLTSLIIPSSVASIGNYAFRGIKCLISVNPANPNYSSLDGVLFDKAQTLLIQYPGSKSGGYVIPPAVVTIGQGAFWACGNLSSVEIPSSVKVIGAQAFWNCYRLISLTIPSTVTSIQAVAFEYCNGLTSITTGWSVPLDISASNQVFDGINKDNCILHVPYRTASFYRSANQWQDFTNIVEASEGFSLGSNVVTLASGAGSNRAVSVTANVPWSVSSNKSWLVPTPASGSNDGSITLTADANTGFDRFAIVTVSSPGQSDQVINVTQSTGLMPLTLSDNMDSSAPIVDQAATLVTSYIDKARYFRFMPTENGTYTFSSTSNSDPFGFLYDQSANYLIMGHTDGSNFSFSYVLTAGQVYYFGIWNPNGGGRNIVVNISGGGLQSLWLSTNSVSLAAPEGSNVTVDVTNPTSWSAGSDQTWLTPSPASGLSSGAMTLTASENTGSSRIATVTVISTGSLNQVVTVTQARSEAPINITAGTLSGVLSATDLASITKLTLTGTIDARDFKTMRDNMPLLAEIDLSGATVVTYTGTDGPEGSFNIYYPPNAVPNFAFYNGSNSQGKNTLTSAILPNSLILIGNSSFRHCYGLASIIIPATTILIGDYAFLSCQALTSLVIPASVTTIGVQSISRCTNLSTINIPASLTSIGFIAFLGSSGVITVEENNPNYSALDGVLFDKTKRNLIQCPVSKTGGYVVPSSVYVIGTYAFFTCNRLTSVTIPSTVQSIGSYAFYSCSGLSSIYSNASTPVDLTSSQSVFYQVNKTTCALYVPHGSTAVYRAANQWQDFINIVEMPEFSLSTTTVSIGAEAGIAISVDLTTGLAWSAISDQSWLSVSPTSGTGNTTFTFTTTSANTSIAPRNAIVSFTAEGVGTPSVSITQAGTNAPLNIEAGGLNSALTPMELASITKLTLTGTINARDFKTMRDNMPLLAELDLSGATVVAYSGTSGTAYSNNIIDYPANEVPENAFYFKTTLTSVILPSSVNSLARLAFYYCSALTGTFTIPSLVTSIGINAFDGCSNLASVAIPASVASIGNPSFSGCSGLFNVDPGNLNYSSLDGVLFNQTKTVLMQVPISKTGSYTIPSSVTSLANQAFWGCNMLTGSLTIPASVTSIGDFVFSGCIGLTSMIIPASVSSIGMSAFADCTGLTSIYSYNKIPVDLSTSPSVFSGVNKSSCTLYVPYGTSALYHAASQWQDFTTIVEMPGFALSALTADVAAPLNSTASVDVTSNTDWSVSSDQSWLVATPNPGSGDHTLMFTAAANPVTSTRTAKVTVSVPGVESQTITVTQAAGELSLKAQLTVILEGVYAGSGLMNTKLRDLSLVPHKQPYNVAPWNYAGKEESADIPTDVVDWILVELRQAGSPSEATTGTIMAGWPKACLLKSNGSVVDADGISLPIIGNPSITSNIYVVFRHRNHIAIMSATGMTRIGDIYTYNFTDGIAKAYGGSSGYRQIVTGVFGMVSGDANSNGDISVLDFTKWATDYGKATIYLPADINGDGQVSVLDFTKWATNFGQTNIAPVKSLNIGGGESQPTVSYKCQVPGN